MRNVSRFPMGFDIDSVANAALFVCHFRTVINRRHPEHAPGGNQDHAV
jgi:hypothetical protein